MTGVGPGSDWLSHWSTCGGEQWEETEEGGMCLGDDDDQAISQTYWAACQWPALSLPEMFLDHISGNLIRVHWAFKYILTFEFMLVSSLSIHSTHPTYPGWLLALNMVGHGEGETGRGSPLTQMSLIWYKVKLIIIWVDKHISCEI